MIIHVVRSGDTLWEIARRYGVDLRVLIRLNGLENPEQLVVGQTIVVPTRAQYYIVRPGDTLWEIARRFNTTVEQIVRENQISDPNLIEPGMMLEIPVTYHTVRPGETLWEIAGRYGVSVQEIVRLNNLSNPNLIYPGTVLTIPQKDEPLIDVNAYVTATGEEGQNVVRRVGQYLTYLSVFSYHVQADGTLQAPVPDDDAVVAQARAENVSPFMVITNFQDGEFSSDLAHTILTQVTVQETLIKNVLNILRNNNYAGLNIDFEYVYPEDRENYNQFLRRITSRLHEEGYPVSTAVAPKTSAEQQGLLYEAHDYEAHGDIVDFVILMTYEWGWAGGPPLAIAPVNEVREVLEYAVTAIPRNKIMMGMPTYGRDWVLPFVPGGPFATSLSPKEAVRRAFRYGVAISYDTTAEAPYYRYIDEQGVQHEVWFEDARSVRAKLRLVQEFQLRGVSYWVLGYEFPQNWLILDDLYTIRKI